MSQEQSRVKVKMVLAKGAKPPVYKSERAAGMDLHVNLLFEDSVTIAPGETLVLNTGVRLAIPPGYEGQVRPRSGLSAKGLSVAFGTIDSDYRGEIGVIVTNVNGIFSEAVDLDRPLDRSETIKDGDRIAQLVIVPVPRVELERVDSLDSTERGENGFGSTGV